MPNVVSSCYYLTPPFLSLFLQVNWLKNDPYIPGQFERLLSGLYLIYTFTVDKICQERERERLYKKVTWDYRGGFCCSRNALV